MGNYSSDTLTIVLGLIISLFWAIVLLIGIRVVCKATHSKLWRPVDAKCNGIKFIQKLHSDGDEYRVQVEYEYSIGAQSYRGSTLTIGYCGSSSFHRENEKYELLNNKREHFVVYVNPLNPGESCVLPGNDRSNYIWVVLPVVGWGFCIAIILIVYLTRGGAHYDF